MAIEISWDFVVETIERDAPALKDFTKIVGLARGGVILASLIQRFHPCAHLVVHDPACVLFVGDDNVLVVDDIWDSGETIKQVKERCFIREGNLHFYTLTSKQDPTLPNHSTGVVLQTPEWIVFPWEIEETTTDEN